MTELMPSLCNDCVARNQCGNDDVKMCISYTKETKIKCDDCKFVENCVDYGWKDCKKFTQKATEPMNNEEWLHTMNAEQLAEFLVMIQMSVMHPVKRGAVDMEKFIEEVVMWLKQPHKE